MMAWLRGTFCFATYEGLMSMQVPRAHAHAQGAACSASCPINHPELYTAADSDGIAPLAARQHAAEHVAPGEETATVYCGSWAHGDVTPCRGLNFRRLPLGPDGVPVGTCSICRAVRVVPELGADPLALAVFLGRFDGEERLALEALVACIQADLAAWKANGEPTDGTMSRLQHATRAAFGQATRDAVEELTRHRRPGEEVDAVIADVRRLCGLYPRL